MRLDSHQFEQLVNEALEELPDEIASRMENVQLVIEDEPDEETAADADTDPENLLGLYQGVPLTERDSSYFGVLPDRIALYRRNLVRISRNTKELRAAVRRTVIHEIAHHFGIDDDRLTELGWD
jgi:predicted Zn-dependent protease with MMP-like domain